MANKKCFRRITVALLSLVMFMGLLPMSALADFDTAVTGGYYTILSEKDYVLCDGATETEIVLNNNDGNRRQVLHVIEVDPNDPNVEVLPAYYGIDKDLTDPANWSAQTMEVQMDYYRDELGYNVVGGMNTALAYDSEAPSSFMVWNGQVLATPALHGNSQTYLAVTKNADDTVSFELRPTTEDLHGDEWQAVSCNFGFVVKDGQLVNTTGSRSDAADRSMIGIKEDGTLVIVQAEGRNAPYAVGLSTYELGEIMLALGCKWAVNGDGGGSSQILTKREGESDYTLRSIPSDGTPRATINGIIVASKAAPSGVFDHVSMIAEHSYITPGASVEIDVKGVDAAGSPAELPTEGISFSVTDGTYADGIYTAGTAVGAQTVTAYYNGEEVGSVTVEVVIPDSLEFNSSEITVPYGRTVVLDISAYYGAFEVPITAADVQIALSNSAVGTLNGLSFTAVSEEVETPTSDITVTLVHDTEVTASAVITLGKGSEVVYDFEDQDLHGFYRSTQANYNYTCAPGETRIVNASTGRVHSGDYAMAVEVDFSASLEAGYQLATLYAGETKIFENAKTLGMWIYIPDEADGLRIDLVINSFDAEGNATSSNTTGQWNIAGAGETTLTEVGFVYSFDESGWYYISKDISAYTYNGFQNGTALLKFYVCQKDGKNGYIYGYQSSVNGKYVFYIDDLTVDYSSAVDDREAPIFSDITYAVAGMDESVVLDGQTLSSNTVSFIASVAENTAKTNYTGINTASGKVYIDGVDYSSELVWGGSSKMALNDVTLADGRHQIKFTVCDKQGNYTSIVRDFVINAAENAPIKVVPHTPDADRLLLGSLYYIDVVAAAVENVQSVSVTLDLNNISTWHLDNMDVAEGFEASYTLAADENIATVTISRTGIVAAAGELALVSIPTRTWQLAPVVAIYGHPGAVWMYPDYKKTNEILPMDLTVETDGGEVVFLDGTTASFSSAKIQVDTELSGNAYTSSGSAAYNYIRNEPWYAGWNGGHDHRAETAQYYAEGATNVSTPVLLEDKEPTCTEDGYIGRTYCEDCQSVVDWGTTVPKTGHTYTLVDGQFVCHCGHVYDLSGQNGLLEMNGSLYYVINGTLKTRWIVDGSNYYYFHPSDYAAVDGVVALEYGYVYTFEDHVLVRGHLDITEKGTRYRWGGLFLFSEWAEVDGNKYYFGKDTYAETGIFFVSNDGLRYAADQNGVWLENYVGTFTHQGDTYYCEYGYMVQDAGLVDIDGELYYFGASGKMVYDGTFWVAKNNGLLPEGNGYYSFDADGRLVKTGFVTYGNATYYYDNLVKAKGFTKIGEDYYFFNTASGKMFTNTTLWVGGGNPYGIAAGYYKFLEDGRMYIPDPNGEKLVVEIDGNLYFTIDGVNQTNGLNELDGEYYYAKPSGVLARSETLWVSQTNDLIDRTGYYAFGSDGKLIKTGFVSGGGATFYYVDMVPAKGFTKIGEDYYFFNVASGRMYANTTLWVGGSNPYGIKPGYYKFLEDGRMYIPDPNGEKLVVEIDGNLYFTIDGVTQTNGLNELDGEYYYAKPSGVLARSETLWVSQTNNLVATTGYYAFDENGRMVKTGFVTGGGATYYYLDAVRVKGFTMIGEDYYFFNAASGRMFANTRLWITANNPYGIAAGYYNFGADGKMELN